MKVRFEKENIWTFDGKGELLITIMSSLAQEESRSISQNVTWGMRKRAADGKTHVPFSIFLGYDKGPNNTFIVNEAQAEIVRRIYGLFLKGLTCYSIAQILMQDGVKTAGGDDAWYSSTIKSILTNEKYKGDCICQKTYRKDFLTKEVIKNQGEVPKYYVEDDHEAIIDKETWEMVQVEMRRRGPGEKKHSSAHLFCGSIKCGECGGWYGPKTWHPGKPYQEVVWVCNERYKKNKEKCHTPILRDYEIKGYFVKAANKLYADKNKVIEKLERIKNEVLSTDGLSETLKEKNKELEALYKVIDEFIDGGHLEVKSAAFQEKYNELTNKYDSLQKEIDAIKVDISDKNARSREITGVLNTLLKQKNIITEFDQALWCLLVDYVTVYSKEEVRVMFRGGIEIGV